MSSKRIIIDSLERKSYKRVCLDIGRHSMKYQAQANKEISDYWKFHMMYNDYLLNTLYQNGEKSSPLENIFSSSNTDCVNFIFNPLVERICFQPNMDFNEEIAFTVSRNCKKLRYLTITNKVLPLNFCVNFLKSLKNLVVLSLAQCSFECVPVMTAIGNSLLHLEFLNLQETDVDDIAISVLCGHRKCRSSCISRCAFVKNCRSVSKLKLRHIVLDYTKISRVGLACVLTHIQTLKEIRIQCYKDSSLKLSNLIRDIKDHRRKLEMPTVQFQLEMIDLVNNLEALQASLDSCPKLKDLCISFSDFAQGQIQAAGRVLEVSELTCLKSLTVQIPNVGSVCTEDFKRFWTKRGHQLHALCLFNFVSGYHTDADVDVLSSVLASCPNLTHLHLIDLLLRKNNGGKSFSNSFPKFLNLDVLCLELYGDNELMNTTALDLIRSAPNIKTLFLGFTACEKLLLPYLKKDNLQSLSELLVKEKERAEEFQDFANMNGVTVKFLAS